MLPFIAIKQYGICLQQMRDADSELVRQGRNQPFVRRNHFHSSVISPEQHREWYARVCDTRDYYFLIWKDNAPLGLFYLKDIALGLDTGHTGFFIWEEKALHTRIPMLATIIFAEFFFKTAGLQNMEAVVHPENQVMLRIAEFFNYQIHAGKDEQTVRILGTYSNYLTQRDRLLSFAQRLSRDPSTWPLKIEGEKDSRHHPEILRLIP